MIWDLYFGKIPNKHFGTKIAQSSISVPFATVTAPLRLANNTKITQGVIMLFAQVKQLSYFMYLHLKYD